MGYSYTQAQSQRKFEKPDYENIEKITKDKNLDSFYPKLFNRYNNNDTSLNITDFTNLYYGYFFQEHNSPINFNDSIKAIYSKNELTKSDRQQLIFYTKKQLEIEPYSLAYLNRMENLYHDLGIIDTSNLCRFKLIMVAKTLVSTGDGKTDTTGIHVNSISDEYTLINLLGYDFDGKQSLTSNQCDYLTIKQNDDGIEGMYFDVKQIFKGYYKMFDIGKKKKRHRKRD